MGSESYHEPLEALSEETRDFHRGIVSLKEELDAVDWYRQRAEACSDAELREVLLHHMNEEIEHAVMNLEWIRRRSAAFDLKLKTYLRTPGSIVAAEHAATDEADGTVSVGVALGIGSLRGGG